MSARETPPALTGSLAGDIARLMSHLVSEPLGQSRVESFVCPRSISDRASTLARVLMGRSSACSIASKAERPSAVARVKEFLC